jgi:hypothetical protein
MTTETYETKNYGIVNNTHILTMFGDEMTYNQLKDLPLDLTTELKVHFHRIEGQNVRVCWSFDDDMVMDWKPFHIHDDLFYHLAGLEDDLELTEDETDEETEDETEEEEVKEAGKPICCFCSHECEYYGNNPEPLGNPDGVCCDSCNEAVVFARMGMVKLARSMLDKKITEKVEKLLNAL